MNRTPKKQQTLFESWNSSVSRQGTQTRPGKGMPNSDVILLDDDDDEIMRRALEESMREFEASRQPITSGAVFTPNSSANVLTTIPVENLPGFDNEAGQTWIYPTNKPVRKYQRDIVETCLFQNTMVTLPTGLGKTFIAAVVMYNYFRWYPRGKIIFLAPTKPLVAQQIQACYEIMGIPLECTSEMTGAMNPTERQKQWKEKRVFFLTPQVLTNDISRSTCPATDVKCLVLDEAHKATGNYAYVQVVQELSKHGAVFRILALSATPGSDLKAIQQVIGNLRIGKIELRNEESPDIVPYVHNRSIEKVIVPLGTDIVQVRDQFLTILGGFARRLMEMNLLFTKDIGSLTKGMVIQSRERFRQNPPGNFPRARLGMAEGDFAMCITLTHALELLLQHGIRGFYNFLAGKTDAMGEGEGVGGHNRTRTELLKVVGFSQMMQELRGRFGEATHGNTPVSHPKLTKLREVVLEHFKRAEAEGRPTRVMIFSQFRDSVHEIVALFEDQAPLIKAMSFVGHGNAAASGTGASKAKGFTQADQIRVIKQFTEGSYNTLVSTCVGEEGLDIGDVDMIICYDVHKSPVRLVQRCGRTGRKRDGRIVMLMTEGREEHIFNQSIYQKKNLMKNMVNSDKLKDFLTPQGPHLIPRHLRPRCHEMPMQVVQAFPAAVARPMKGAGASATTAAARKSKTTKCYYLTDAEQEYWARHLQTDEPLPTLRLDKWLPWQSSLQSTGTVGHSQLTRHFVEILQHIERQQDESFVVGHLQTTGEHEVDPPHARTPSPAPANASRRLTMSPDRLFPVAGYGGHGGPYSPGFQALFAPVPPRPGSPCVPDPPAFDFNVSPDPSPPASRPPFSDPAALRSRLVRQLLGLSLSADRTSEPPSRSSEVEGPTPTPTVRSEWDLEFGDSFNVAEVMGRTPTKSSGAGNPFAQPSPVISHRPAVRRTKTPVREVSSVEQDLWGPDVDVDDFFDCPVTPAKAAAAATDDLPSEPSPVLSQRHRAPKRKWDVASSTPAPGKRLKLESEVPLVIRAESAKSNSLNVDESILSITQIVHLIGSPSREPVRIEQETFRPNFDLEVDFFDCSPTRADHPPSPIVPSTASAPRVLESPVFDFECKSTSPDVGGPSPPKVNFSLEFPDFDDVAVSAYEEPAPRVVHQESQPVAKAEFSLEFPDFSASEAVDQAAPSEPVSKRTSDSFDHEKPKSLKSAWDDGFDISLSDLEEIDAVEQAAMDERGIAVDEDVKPSTSGTNAISTTSVYNNSRIKREMDDIFGMSVVEAEDESLTSDSKSARRTAKKALFQPPVPVAQCQERSSALLKNVHKPTSNLDAAPPSVIQIDSADDDDDFLVASPPTSRQRFVGQSVTEDGESPLQARRKPVRPIAPVGDESPLPVGFQSRSSATIVEDSPIAVRRLRCGRNPNRLQTQSTPVANRAADQARKKKKAASSFIEDEAENSLVDGSISDDEIEDDNPDIYEGSFVDDQPSSNANDTMMRAVYLESVKNPAVHNGFVFRQPARAMNRSEIFSQAVADEDSEYDYDSFCVEDEEEGDNRQEDTAVDDLVLTQVPAPPPRNRRGPIRSVAKLNDERLGSLARLRQERLAKSKRCANPLEENRQQRKRIISQPSSSESDSTPPSKMSAPTSPMPPPTTFALNKEERLKRQRQKQEEFRRSINASVVSISPSDRSAPSDSLACCVPSTDRVALTTGSNNVDARNPLPSRILVSSRQVSVTAQIISSLQVRYKCTTHVCSFDVADFVVSSQLGVIRKLHSDFTNGTQRCRLQEQVRKLTTLYDRPVLIVEADRGGSRDPRSKADPTPEASSVIFKPSTPYVLQTLALLAQTDLSVLHSESQEQTARWLNDLSRQESLRGSILPEADKLNAKQAEFVKFLQRIPVINPAVALLMAANYRNLREILNSTAEVITQRCKISESKARNIVLAFRVNHPSR